MLGTKPFVLDEAARRAAEAVRGLSTPLCAECSGRFFGKIGHGLTNSERWDAIMRELDPQGAARSNGEGCGLCSGAFGRIGDWVDRARRSVADYEWASFLCGSRWAPETLALEEALWGEVATSWGESIRTAFNREFGKALGVATGAVARQENPDVLFVADISVGQIELTIASLHFLGRYRKLDRTIPQTRWPCRECRGRGCRRCNGTGKMYETSVEELIAGPLNQSLRGTGHRFHGMGREDIDARMLGRGRPFVAEILSPHVRTMDATAAEKEINASAGGRVEVLELTPCAPLDVRRVKEEKHDKSYRVVVRGSPGEEKIKEAVNMLSGRELVQRTPVRVAHRRADLMRHRSIKEMKMTQMGEGTFTLEIRAEAGTYIKEFVTGDNGRTQPNLSEVLGIPLSVVELDVTAIHDEKEDGTW